MSSANTDNERIKLNVLAVLQLIEQIYVTKEYDELSPQEKELVGRLKYLGYLKDMEIKDPECIPAFAGIAEDDFNGFYDFVDELAGISPDPTQKPVNTSQQLLLEGLIHRS